MELLQVETNSYHSEVHSTVDVGTVYELYMQIKCTIKSHDIQCVSHPAPSDYRAVAVTLMFPSGSSSTPTPPQQCTSIIITNEGTPGDQDKSFTLLASSSNPGVFFAPGRNTASVVIHDDDSKL